MLAVITNSAYAADPTSGNRFPIPKFNRFYSHLEENQLLLQSKLVQGRNASRDELSIAHKVEYIDNVFNQKLTKHQTRTIGLKLTHKLIERVRASVGGTMMAASEALKSGLALNMAGGSHHAFFDRGSGYCVFNDCAVAALWARTALGIGKVLVVDLDVHQGDGTAQILEKVPDIFTFSLHCSTNFPTRKMTSDLDIALPSGTGDQVYLQTLNDALTDLMDRFLPDLVFYNAGVDPHHEDALGKLSLTDRGLFSRDHFVLSQCLERGIPVAAVMGGGYGTDHDAVIRRHAILHHAAHNLLTESYRPPANLLNSA